MSVHHSARSGGIIGIFFRFNMKVCCVFSLESPHRCDSNAYTKHTIFNIKKKITLNYPKYNGVCTYGIFFLGTYDRVRNNRGKRAVGVLLYMKFKKNLRPVVFPLAK